MDTTNLRCCILMMGPLPPPLGGQSVLINSILESRLASRFELIPFNMSHRNPGPFRRALLTVRFLLRLLATLIWQHQIRVLHIHSSAGIALIEKGLYIVAGKLFGKRIILHLHGGNLVPSWRSAGPMRKRLIKGLLNCCDAMIVLSRSR